jgi:hypothetical protein
MVPPRVIWKLIEKIGKFNRPPCQEEIMKKYTILIAGIIASIFGTGTLIWWATDVFALFSTNEFTGRMRSFDVEYWNAIAGSAILIIGSGILKGIKTLAARKAVDSWHEETEDILDDELTRKVFEQLKSKK